MEYVHLFTHGYDSTIYPVVQHQYQVRWSSLTLGSALNGWGGAAYGVYAAAVDGVGCMDIICRVLCVAFRVEFCVGHLLLLFV